MIKLTFFETSQFLEQYLGFPKLYNTSFQETSGPNLTLGPYEMGTN